MKIGCTDGCAVLEILPYTKYLDVGSNEWLTHNLPKRHNPLQEYSLWKIAFWKLLNGIECKIAIVALNQKKLSPNHHLRVTSEKWICEVNISTYVGTLANKQITTPIGVCQSNRCARSAIKDRHHLLSLPLMHLVLPTLSPSPPHILWDSWVCLGIAYRQRQ